MNVLDEAAQLIDGERQDQYGDASESHRRIADLWASYLGTDVTEFDVVNMMILLKISRTRNQYHRDSYVDIAGYSALGERLYQTAAGTGVQVDLDPYLNYSVVKAIRQLRVPRVWESLDDVPCYVVVADTDGESWKVNEEGRQLYLGPSSQVWIENRGQFDPDLFSPFTEVLEDK